jgi:Zn finger protein HypA/HybF involved in hydrogenase expression
MEEEHKVIQISYIEVICVKCNWKWKSGLLNQYTCPSCNHTSKGKPKL